MHSTKKPESSRERAREMDNGLQVNAEGGKVYNHDRRRDRRTVELPHAPPDGPEELIEPVAPVLNIVRPGPHGLESDVDQISSSDADADADDKTIESDEVSTPPSIEDFSKAFKAVFGEDY
jgi:hypothetical protein